MQIANLISMSDIKAIKDKQRIQRKTLALKDVQKIDCLGTCRLKVTVKEKVHHLPLSCWGKIGPRPMTARTLFGPDQKLKQSALKAIKR